MRFRYRSTTKLLALIPGLVGYGVVSAQEVLPPAEAFPYTIEASADQIILNFAVEDG